jgi:chromosome segregation ATPase
MNEKTKITIIRLARFVVIIFLIITVSVMLTKLLPGSAGAEPTTRASLVDVHNRLIDNEDEISQEKVERERLENVKKEVLQNIEESEVRLEDLRLERKQLRAESDNIINAPLTEGL